MNNIFENAYFGKPYKTRDERKALYHSYDNIYPDNPYQNHHNLILEEKDGVRDTIWIWCNDYGHTEEHVEGKWLNETNSDIVSHWQEEINKEELDKLAWQSTNKKYGKFHTTSIVKRFSFRDGFIAGYRAAKQELI